MKEGSNVPVNNKNVMKYIKSDVFRYYGKCDTLTLLKGYILNPVVRFHFALRLSSCAGGIGVVGRILWWLSFTKRRIILPFSTQIGYGLFIGHGGPIVVILISI